MLPPEFQAFLCFYFNYTTPTFPLPTYGTFVSAHFSHAAILQITFVPNCHSTTNHLVLEQMLPTSKLVPIFLIERPHLYGRFYFNIVIIALQIMQSLLSSRVISIAWASMNNGTITKLSVRIPSVI